MDIDGAVENLAESEQQFCDQEASFLLVVQTKQQSKWRARRKALAMLLLVLQRLEVLFPLQLNMTQMNSSWIYMLLAPSLWYSQLLAHTVKNLFHCLYKVHSLNLWPVCITKSYADLPYKDLVEVCANINVSVSQKQAIAVVVHTRGQAASKLW